jgi:hypothetical protein
MREVDASSWLDAYGAYFQNNRELSEIIMEINDLQRTFLDNQPLAQTALEINDLREFSPLFEDHRNWLSLIFRRFIFLAFFLFFSVKFSQIHSN